MGFTLENNFSFYSLQAKTNGKFLQKREMLLLLFQALYAKTQANRSAIQETQTSYQQLQKSIKPLFRDRRKDGKATQIDWQADMKWAKP